MFYEFLEIGRKRVDSWEYEEDVPFDVSCEKMFGGNMCGEDDPADYAGDDERVDI